MADDPDYFDWSAPAPASEAREYYARTPSPCSTRSPTPPRPESLGHQSYVHSDSDSEPQPRHLDETDRTLPGPSPSTGLFEVSWRHVPIERDGQTIAACVPILADRRLPEGICYANVVPPHRQNDLVRALGPRPLSSDLYELLYDEPGNSGSVFLPLRQTAPGLWHLDPEAPLQELMELSLGGHRIGAEQPLVFHMDDLVDPDWGHHRESSPSRSPRPPRTSGFSLLPCPGRQCPFSRDRNHRSMCFFPRRARVAQRESVRGRNAFSVLANFHYPHDARPSPPPTTLELLNRDAFQFRFSRSYQRRTGALPSRPPRPESEDDKRAVRAARRRGTRKTGPSWTRAGYCWLFAFRSLDRHSRARLYAEIGPYPPSSLVAAKLQALGLSEIQPISFADGRSRGKFGIAHLGFGPNASMLPLSSIPKFKLGVRSAYEMVQAGDYRSTYQARLGERVMRADSHNVSICDYMLSKEAEAMMTHLGLPYSPNASLTHSHPVHKAIHNYILYELAQILTPGTLVIGMKRSKFESFVAMILRAQKLEVNDENRAGFYLAHPVVTARDSSRYGSDIALPTNSDFPVRTIFIHDAAHFMSPGALPPLFHLYPALDRIYSSVIIPWEIRHLAPSVHPDLYQIHYTDDGLSFIYSMEGDGSLNYEQPISCGEWLHTNSVELVKSEPHLSVGPIFPLERIITHMNSHVYLMVRDQGMVLRNFDRFDLPDMAFVPCIAPGIKPVQPFIPLSTLRSAVMHCKSLEAASFTLEVANAKIRTHCSANSSVPLETIDILARLLHFYKSKESKFLVDLMPSIWARMRHTIFVFTDWMLRKVRLGWLSEVLFRERLLFKRIREVVLQDRFSGVLQLKPYRTSLKVLPYFRQVTDPSDFHAPPSSIIFDATSDGSFVENLNVRSRSSVASADPPVTKPGTARPAWRVVQEGKEVAGSESTLVAEARRIRKEVAPPKRPGYDLAENAHVKCRCAAHDVNIQPPGSDLFRCGADYPIWLPSGTRIVSCHLCAEGAKAAVFFGMERKDLQIEAMAVLPVFQPVLPQPPMAPAPLVPVDVANAIRILGTSQAHEDSDGRPAVVAQLTSQVMQAKATTAYVTGLTLAAPHQGPAVSTGVPKDIPTATLAGRSNPTVFSVLRVGPTDSLLPNLPLQRAVWNNAPYPPHDCLLRALEINPDGKKREEMWNFISEIAPIDTLRGAYLGRGLSTFHAHLLGLRFKWKILIRYPQGFGGGFPYVGHRFGAPLVLSWTTNSRNVGHFEPVSNDNMDGEFEFKLSLTPDMRHLYGAGLLDEAAALTTATYTADRKIAKKFWQAWQRLHFGTRHGLERFYGNKRFRDDDQVDFFLRNNPEPTVKIGIFEGLPGCGKSFPLKQLLSRNPKEINYNRLKVAFPRLFLKESWKSSFESTIDNRQCFQTFETAVFCEASLLILDEFTLFPPGWLDFVLIVNLESRIETVLCAGDGCQGHWFSEAEGVSLTLERSFYDRLTHVPRDYLYSTRRVPQALAQRLGIPSLSANTGTIYHHRALASRNVPLLVPSDADVGRYASLGYKTFTYTSCQGLEWNRVQILLTPALMLMQDFNSLFVAFTRSNDAIHVINALPGDEWMRLTTHSFLGPVLGWAPPTLLTNLFRKQLRGKPLILPPQHFLYGAEPDQDMAAALSRWAGRRLEHLPAATRVLCDHFLEPSLPEPRSSDPPPDEPHVPTTFPTAPDPVALAEWSTYKCREDRELFIRDTMGAQYLDTMQNRLGAFPLAPESAAFQRHTASRDPTVALSAFTARFRRATPLRNHEQLKTRQFLGPILFQAFQRILGLPEFGPEFDPALFSLCILENMAVKLNKPIATLWNNVDRSDPDWALNFMSVFVKSQIKAKETTSTIKLRYFEDDPIIHQKDASAGQILVTCPDVAVLLFGPVMRYMKYQLYRLMPEHVYIHGGKTYVDLDNWCRKFAKSGQTPTCDFTQYDQSCQAETLAFEGVLFDYFNITSALPHIPLLYFDIKLTMFTELGTGAVQRFTGEFCTYDFNTWYNIAYMALRFNLNFESGACAFSGDDSLFFFPLVEWKRWRFFSDHFSLEGKHVSTSLPDFCGWWLTPVGAIRNSVLLVMKIIYKTKIYAEFGKRIRNSELRKIVPSYFIEASFANSHGDAAFNVLPPLVQEAQQWLNSFFFQNRDIIPISLHHLFRSQSYSTIPYHLLSSSSSSLPELL